MTDRQYKIMHITMRFSGGIFTFLQDLTEGLCNDFQQTIIYAAYPNMPQNVRSHFNKKVQLIRLNTYAADHNPLADNQTRNELKDLVAQEKPDIIHLHGYTAGRLGRQAFETLRIPILYTPHGYLYLAEDRNRLSRSLLRRTEQNLSGGNTTTIACSKGEFAETLNFTKNATFINNGINTALIDQLMQDVEEKQHPFTVFTTGLINPQKNPDLFNEIARAMPNVHFLWIGDGESKWKLTSPNIEITGWLDHSEAIKKMNDGDVFLLTSLWEGLPISLLEAMYLKKLCIVSNVVGSRDVITNGENGFICDSAASFVNTINHYFDPESKDIRENAYQDIMDNYTLKEMIENYKTFYKEKIMK